MAEYNVAIAIWSHGMSGYAGNRRRLLSWQQRKYRSKKSRKRKLRTAPAKVLAYIRQTS